MQMYSVVNVENLKLYEPPLIMENDEVGTIPTVDDFAPEYLDELPKDIILDRIIRTSRRGDVEYLQVGLKGMHPNKARWLEKENNSLTCQLTNEKLLVVQRLLIREE